MEIHILNVNDFHAEILESEGSLGCAKMSAAIKNWKSGHPNTIVVFGGDNYKGDPISEFSEGIIVSEFMQEVGTRVSVVGNHDLDFGVDYLKKWQEEGSYRFLAANLVERGSKSIPEYITPYQMIECQGIKVAIIGLAGMEELDTAVRPKDIQDLEILNGTACIQKWITYLNEGKDEKGKPDLIIALTHFGLKFNEKGVAEGEELLDLCRNTNGIAGGFAAHWHQFMSVKINGIPIAQGGGCGQGFSVLTITAGEDNQILSVESQYVDLRNSKDNLEPDLKLDKLVKNEYKKAMKVLGEVIGTAGSDIIHRNNVSNEVFYEGSSLSALATEVMKEQSDSNIALFYSGWLGTGLSKGAITLCDMHQVMRFNGSMVTMKIKGKTLLKNLELGIRNLKDANVSPLAIDGICIVADVNKSVGNRLESAVLSDGSAIWPEELYQIVVDGGIAENGMGFDFSESYDRCYLDISIRLCMIEKIQLTGKIEDVKQKTFVVKKGGTPV